MIDSTKTAELEFMLALKKYIGAIVTESLKKNGVEAALPSTPARGPETRPTRWIYFIQGEDGGPIKIGVANDPEKRLGELQRTSPTKLRIIGRRGGDVFAEKQLHAKYAEYRLHGEWFEPTEEILEEAERDEDVAA